jgi:hypothetical protein
VCGIVVVARFVSAHFWCSCAGCEQRSCCCREFCECAELLLLRGLRVRIFGVLVRVVSALRSSLCALCALVCERLAL